MEIDAVYDIKSESQKEKCRKYILYHQSRKRRQSSNLLFDFIVKRNQIISIQNFVI